jgi:hypothetical protein
LPLTAFAIIYMLPQENIKANKEPVSKTEGKCTPSMMNVSVTLKALYFGTQDGIK